MRNKMNSCIVLAIDTDLSPTTLHALTSISAFLEQSAPTVRLLLLHVIPLTQVVSAQPGMYVGQVFPGTATTAQREHAQAVLYKARLLLAQQGISMERTEGVVREGLPADEITRAARELHASFIVVGRHEDALKHKIRRFLLGSTSQRILQLASCPVYIAVLPPPAKASDLSSWYMEAIKGYLDEHPSSLSVFTPEQAARRFAPPGKSKIGRQEVKAASRALEDLATGGLLCRHEIKGELRYVND
ncbi:hypothetical protein KSD_20480 [Ktedonobacter sp. SOSP1-85]|nr:hypothetical protein KSD_20480 [Ktedonobacter sp. SOSP1-85]